MNDSKAPFGSHRDLHANIGTGFLGLQAFHNVMNYGPFQNLPMVLETPIDEKGDDGKTVENKKIWADEIKLLEVLLARIPRARSSRPRQRNSTRKGKPEREKIQAQVDKKNVKDSKKAAKGPAKAKKSVRKKADSDAEDSD